MCLTVLSFRDTFSVTWDPSWLTPFWGQLFPVLLLGKNINEIIPKELYARAVFTYVCYCGGKVLIMAVESVVFMMICEPPLLFPCQVANVRLCDANEEGGTAGRRLLLHWLSVLRRNRLCHRPWFAVLTLHINIDRLHFYLFSCSKLAGSSTQAQTVHRNSKDLSNLCVLC